MKPQTERWTVAELVPPILLGLVGLNLLLAAPARSASSTTEPTKRPPRISPAKPPSANRSMLAASLCHPEHLITAFAPAGAAPRACAA